MSRLALSFLYIGWIRIFLTVPEDDPPTDLPEYHDIAPDVGMVRPNSFGSPAKKLITETTGSGAAFFDYDGDGRLDLYIVNGQTLEQADTGTPGEPNQLFRNLGLNRFQDVTARAAVGDTGWGGGAAAADYDNDGDTDLLVTNYGPNVFYRNNGDGTFTDITEWAGVEDKRWSASAAFGDINGDGFLDLYVTNYVPFSMKLLEGLDTKFCQWRGIQVMCGPNGLPGEADAFYINRGDGTFREVTEEAGVLNTEGKGLGVTFLDHDQDGDQDIYVANDSTPDYLYENDGQGHFTDMALLAGVAVSMYGKPQAGMGIDVGDFDEDGLIDIVVTNFQGDYNALRRNEGDGLFTDVSDMAGLTAPSFEKLGWGVKFIDANHDGFLDLLVSNGHVYPEVEGGGIGESYRQSNQVLLNLPDAAGRKYEDVTTETGSGFKDLKSSRGLAVGDYDNDGDLDVFVNNMGDIPNFLEDRTEHKNGWVRLTLIGKNANRDSLGARVEYTAQTQRHFRLANVWSYLSTNDPRLLLGLGPAAEAEDVVIYWHSSSPPLKLGAIAAGEDVLVLEGFGRLR